MMKRLIPLLSSALLLMGLLLASCQRDGSEPNNPDNPNGGGGTGGGTAGVMHKDLLIEEVYYFGNYYLQASKNNNFEPRWMGAWTDKHYNKYIRITNPTNEVKYLDGVGLAISQYSLLADAKNKPAFAESFDKKRLGSSLAVSTIYLFPGSGKEYPIQPNESKIIATSAVDAAALEKEELSDPDFEGEYKLEACDFSSLLDLSKADFEINDENDAVPSLIPFYSYDAASKGKLNPESFGNFDLGRQSTLALVRFGITPEELKKEISASIQPNKKGKVDVKEGKYILNTPYAARGHEFYLRYRFGLFLPNEWILDFVMIAAKNDATWAINPNLDKKHNGVHQTDSEGKDPTTWARYVKKALVRKNDGRSIVDTNNSSLDFEVKDASLYKKQ